MTTHRPQVISWPLGPIDESGRLPYARDDHSVREVMRNILLTRPGERLMRAEFGAGLLDFIHEPNNETTRHLIADVVRKSIEQWELRVRVEDVLVLPDPVNLAEVHITIRYRMRFSETPLELGLSLTLGQLA